MTAEVTYGLERLAYIQEVDPVYDIEWADGVKYGTFHHPEYEHSKYCVLGHDQDPALWGILEKFSGS